MNRTEGPGWEVMHAALRLAQEQLGPQLVSAYALGSLVHGGFVPEVSDVDLALILQDVTPETEGEMQKLKQRVVKEQRSPLAARLSLFWTTWAALKSGGRLGRFPLTDRLDLLDDGQPLRGPDWRSEIPRPGRVELIKEAAEFMLHKLATPENNALLRDPLGLMAQGPRQVAKAVLFPVRFIYTAEVGGLAANPMAAQHFIQTRRNILPGTAQLVQAALEWREQGSAAEARILDLLQAELLPLHAELVRVYLNSLPDGAAELRGGLRRWQVALEA